jgi:hypothetical protein
MDARLVHPANYIFAGPTFAGKTTAVVNLLLNSQELIHPAPSSIVYCYGEEQCAYEKLKTDSPIPITFYDTFNREIYSSLPRGCVCVLDDLLHSLPEDLLNEVVIRGTHHRDVSLICIVHNIFQKTLRTVSLNSQYYFLFKSCRDLNQLKVFANQLGVNSKFFISVYKDATKLPHDFLFIDLRPSTPEELRFKSNIFKHPISVYLPPNA